MQPHDDAMFRSVGKLSHDVPSLWLPLVYCHMMIQSSGALVNCHMMCKVLAATSKLSHDVQSLGCTSKLSQ